jgi:energy-coupling factor transport system permease protein
MTLHRRELLRHFERMLQMVETNLADNAKPRGWRVIDFVVAAVMAVVLGVGMWAYDTFAYAPVGVLFSSVPWLAGLQFGIWTLPAIAGAVIVRRPGAALLAELIAATVEVSLGNTWGATSLYSALLQGAAVELVLLLVWYRSFNYVVVALAGAAAALAEVLVYESWAYWGGTSTEFLVSYLVACIASGASIAGIGGLLLVRALRRAGVLGAFAK